MATAPLSTVGSTAASSTEPGALKYVQEFLVGAATVLQEVPTELVPFVGPVCRVFLSFEKFVETAKSNKGELDTLLQLCRVVIEGVLDRRSNRPTLPDEGFKKLRECVEDAEKLASFCSGTGKRERGKRFILARKISDDIAGIRSKLEAFCSVNILVLADDTHAAVGKLATDLVGKFEDVMKLAITQVEYQAMKNEVKDLHEEIDTKDEASLELKVELRTYQSALAAAEVQLEEQRKVTALASKVKAPPGAPRVRDSYVERKAMLDKARGRLGVGSSASGKPQMVGVAGPSGSGKSTFASMVIDQEDVRASFHEGVLWLRVGQGAKNHLPELMFRLAVMVYEVVLEKDARPPRKASLGIDPEDGAAYIREVAGEVSRRFLVVADDVWEVEVLRELETAQVWVLYTTRQTDLLLERPLRLDQLRKGEAEMVLRRAAEIGDDSPLPEAAYELMGLCEYSVMHLAFIGRWRDVRERRSDAAWRTVLDRLLQARDRRNTEFDVALLNEPGLDSVLENLEQDEGGDVLPWRVAVLRAGLEELDCDDKRNKELYIALALIPKGFMFPSEVVAVLLYGGNNLSAEDVEAAEGVAAVLERWSVLSSDDGGMYRVHDGHADFARECISAYPKSRQKALPLWRGYISSVQALVTYSSFWLTKVWDVFSQVGGDGVSPRPFKAALDAAGPSNADISKALGRAARFHWRRKDWLAAYNTNSRLLQMNEHVHGRRSLETASTLHALGTCLHNTGQMKEAEELYRQSLAIWKERRGDDHLDVARALYSLGVCVYALARTKEAEMVHLEALSIREKQLGEDHLDVAKVLHSLGVCVGSTGRWKEADDFFVRALGTRKKLRVGHPDLSSTLIELVQSTEKHAGLTKEVRGVSFAEFTRVRKSAAAGSTSLYSVGPCARYMGMQVKGGVEEADEEKALHRLALVEEHGNSAVAGTLHGIGAFALKGGQLEEAEKYLLLALALREKYPGANHPDIASTVHAVDEGSGEFYFRQWCTAIGNAKVGAHHPDVASTMHKLAQCAIKARRRVQAKDFLRRALLHGEERLGADYTDVADTMEVFAECAQVALVGQDRKETLASGLRMLAILVLFLRIDHPIIASTLKSLQGLCRGYRTEWRVVTNWLRACQDGPLFGYLHSEHNLCRC